MGIDGSSHSSHAASGDNPGCHTGGTQLAAGSWLAWHGCSPSHSHPSQAACREKGKVQREKLCFEEWPSTNSALQSFESPSKASREVSHLKRPM